MVPLDGRTFLAASAALLVLAGVAGLWTLGGPAPVAQAPSDAAPSSLSPPAFATTPPETPVSRPVAAKAPDAWQPTDASSVVAQRYREARDKRGFYARAVETGGAAHLYFARVAAVDCLFVSTRGEAGGEQLIASFAGNTYEGSYPERIEAYRRVTAGCRGFETSPVVDAELRDLNTRLRQLDEPIALNARLFEAVRNSRRDEGKALARRMLESGDPYAIQQMPYAMAHFHRPIANEYARTPQVARQISEWQAEQSAWTLAACSLGYPCVDSEGRSDNLCLWGGECGRVDFEASSLRHQPPERRAGILERRDAIVAAVRARDWAALGL